MATRRYAGVRVYSHADSLRDLVVGLAEIGSWLKKESYQRTVFLQRGWLHGSHVELIVRSEPDRRLPWESVCSAASLLADRMPRGSRDEDEYLSEARQLGVLERISPPYLPLAAHRTVVEVRDDEANPWPGELGDMRARALGRMFEPMRLSHARRQAGDLRLAVAGAFAVLADEHPWGIGLGSFSYRSHAEAFLHQHPQMRELFSRRLAADRRSLTSIVASVLEGTETTLAGRWRAAFAYCLGQFDCAADRGVLTESALESISPALPPSNRGVSEFHTEVAASGVAGRAGTWFVGFRLLLNLFYRQLPLLDISPVQRFYLCHAIAEVTEELTGRTWRDRLERARRDVVGRPSS